MEHKLTPEDFKCIDTGISDLKVSSAYKVKKNKVLVWNKKIENSNIEKYKKFIEERYGLHFDTYWDLHAWSVDCFETFWESIWSYYEIVSLKSYKKIFLKTGPGFLDCRWFHGAKFNYAENLLRRRDDKVALTYLDEDGNFETVTYKELYEEVRLYAAAFRKNGLKKGDVVACYFSNRKEAVFGILAALSIGAAWGGPAPFMGEVSASQLISKSEAKFLMVVDRFQCHGKEYEFMKRLPNIVKNAPTLTKVIIIPTKEETLSLDITHIENSCFLNDFLESGKSSDGTVPALIFEQLSASHPVFVSFSSGTTGCPEGIVHPAGILLPQLLELGVHWNLNEGDVLLSSFPPGWAVWNYSLVCLTIGANLVLFNSSVLHVFSDKTNIWDILAKYKVKLTLMVPDDVDKIQKDQIIPNADSNLDHFQTLILGAAPMKLQNYDFLLQNVKKDMFIGLIYGATETYGAYTGFNLNMPAYAFESQIPALGKDNQCFDENGHAVFNQIGEAVLINPSPSLPSYLLHDIDNIRLNEKYCTKYPGNWCQNDICYINPETKGIAVIGRSDGIIKQYGLGFAASEIYESIHDIEGIKDYICVGQLKEDGDMRAVLFIKMENGYLFSDELKLKICEKIEEELTEYHIPQVILQVDDIPYNLRKKRLEKVVRTIIDTNKIPHVENIKNPESLYNFIDIPEIIKYSQP